MSRPGPARRARARAATPAAALALGALLAGCTGGGPAAAPTGSSPAPGPASSSAPAVVDDGVPSAGADGAGDPYFPLDGNGGYDALHYDLRVSVGADLRTITGDATLTARTTQALSAYDLDLHGLTVSSVTVDGRAARWERDGQELVITPAAPLRAGTTFRTRVRYAGSPTLLPGDDGVQNGWYVGQGGAAVLGEPQGASVWFPVSEHPSDKATYTVTVSVPQGRTAVSNGLPVGPPVTAGGRTTWRWRTQHPMASYLVLLAVGDLTLHRWTTDSGLPVVDAVGPGVPASANAALARQGEVIDVLSATFGPYPFEAAGAVVVPEVPQVALETQTRPVYGAPIMSGDHPVYVLAHELAHQWFGDSVSLSSWRDVWLNEGFATYAEYLWGQHVDGLDPATMITRELSSAPADDPFWTTDISDPGPQHLFDAAVYYRGACVLEALREVVGDDAFRTTLRRWAAEHRDGNGTTAAFVALAQQVSGRDLTAVFDTWLYSTHKPDGWDPAAVAAAAPVGSAPTA